MKRAYGISAIAFTIIASAAIAFGQAAKKPASAEDERNNIAVLDHIWLDAAHNRDTATLQWLFAEKFVEVHPGGFIVNKQEQIDQIMDPQRVLNEIHPDNIRGALHVRRTWRFSRTPPRSRERAAALRTMARNA